MSAVRHHFVPQGYLRGFAATGEASASFVWVYDKRSGRAPSRKSVRSIAWAAAYYATEQDDGSEDLDTVETKLAQTIDNKIPILLERIKPTVGRSITLTEQEKGELAFFVGLSMTRVPSFRDGINAWYSQIAHIGLSQQIRNDPLLAEFARSSGLKVTAKPWVSLRPMVLMAKAIATAALANRWQFFVPPSSVPLVTSDNPVLFSGGAAGLDQLGPAHPHAELVINLRKDLALVSTPKKGPPDMHVFGLSPAEARKFNRGIVRAARHRVFADHRSDLFDAFVKKYSDTEQRIIV